MHTCTVNWTCTKHADLGGSRGMHALRIICCSKIESGGFWHL